MRMDIRAGTIIAGFRVESLLGEGAMGTVYLAEEATSGRRVALKLLAPELASDERFRARFLRETELAASLDDPHVVPTLASGEENGVLYLAMALVEGSDHRPSPWATIQRRSASTHAPTRSTSPTPTTTRSP